MKKIFTLLAMAIMAMSSFAQGDVMTLTLNGSEVSDPAGFFTHDTNGKFSFNNKFNGAEYDGITFTKGLKMEASTKIMFTTTTKSDIIIVQSTWSDKTLAFDDVELAVDDAEAGTGCRIYTITGVEAGDHWITRVSGESGIFYVKVTYTEADTAPSISISPKSVDLACMPGATEATAKITVTGKNLPDGTYAFAMPNLAGLAIDPAAVTVSGGTVQQEITVFYSSTDDVPASSQTLTIEIGGASASFVVNYSSRASLVELQSVSEAKVWDWTLLTETVELSDDSTPFTINDSFCFANLDSKINFPEAFDAASIQIINTQYPSRSKKFQNGTIGIQTTVDGVLSVNFSDTGASGDGKERYLTVNGTIDLIIDGQGTQQIYTKRDGTSDPKEVTDIAVKAGNITICGSEYYDKEDDEGNIIERNALKNTAIVVTKVTFTPKSISEGTTTGISSVETASAASDAIFNLAGQKVSAQYKGMVLKNGRKQIQK